MVTPSEILKKHWGFDTFRPLQEEIIKAALAKKDALALLPTGGGKSICYQVPALMQEGICLVVSPLIALMKDQVEGLKRRGIMALSIYSGLSRRAIVQTLKNASSEEYKFLYVSPERLETDLFKEYLPALDINLIAVDEAHCISQWGYDFRPAYLKIAELRKELPNVPVLALTASATPEVQKDICEKLLLTEQAVFRQSYQRPNLSYSVFAADSKQAKLVDILTKVPGSALVYCRSRKRTVEITSLLQMHGLSAQYYHAGLPSNERAVRQQAWIENKTAVMVCTTAFGMGIDKPDVRAVVHVDLPESLEHYYQEAGRAGRDGKKSYAVLLYTEKDLSELKTSHNIRFPSFEIIKKIYSALVNYLGIPAGTAEDAVYTFRFDEWIRNFSLNSTEALYALKALESDGWLQFNEQNFTPTTVKFTTYKQELYAFQEAHTQYEPLITAMLRTYGGIMDYPVAISEKTLARMLRKEEGTIKKELFEIAANHIIEYKPQTDTPQIILRKQRVPVDDLKVDLTLFNNRKQAYINRVEKMISYTGTKSCRSTLINTYFGDSTERCGVCDNCLAAKATPLTADEVAKVTERITAILTKPTAVQDIIQSLKGISKEKAWKVLEFLQSEGLITTDATGKLVLKKASVATPPAGGSTQT